MLNKCYPCVYFSFVEANKVEGGFMCLSKKVQGKRHFLGVKLGG